MGLPMFSYYATLKTDQFQRMALCCRIWSSSKHLQCRYLMGPDMGFVKFFGKNNDVDTLTDGIINEIKRYKK